MDFDKSTFYNTPVTKYADLTAIARDLKVCLCLFVTETVCGCVIVMRALAVACHVQSRRFAYAWLLEHLRHTVRVCVERRDAGVHGTRHAAARAHEGACVACALL
jgi:hypothetical protein